MHLQQQLSQTALSCGGIVGNQDIQLQNPDAQLQLQDFLPQSQWKTYVSQNTFYNVPDMTLSTQ